MSMRRHALLLPLAAVVLTGCPSSSHRIRKGDLMALSQLPPENRSHRIPVVQSLGSRDEPPEQGTRVTGGATVVVYAPIWVGGAPSPHNEPSACQGTAQTTARAAVSKKPSGVFFDEKDTRRLFCVNCGSP